MSHLSRSTRYPSNKRPVAIILLLFAILVGWGAYRWLQGLKVPVSMRATLLVVQGEATVTRADAEEVSSLRQGETAVLQRGDEVRTGRESRARLTLGEGRTTEMGGETHLAVLDLSSGGLARSWEVVLAMHQGETLTHIAHQLLDKTTFVVETKVVTLRASGTEFQCDALTDHVYVAVFDGLVTVSMGAQSLELAAGQSLEARLGQTLDAAPVSRSCPLRAPTPTLADAPTSPTLTDREKTLFPPVLTPTRPEDLYQVYTVQKGDTLYSIARDVGVSWEAIWAANKDRLTSPELIREGQELRIPKP